MEQRDILSIGKARSFQLTRDTIARSLALGYDPRGRSDSALEAMIDGGAVRPGAWADEEADLMPAAVLVPLVERPGGLTQC